MAIEVVKVDDNTIQIIRRTNMRKQQLEQQKNELQIDRLTKQNKSDAELTKLQDDIDETQAWLDLLDAPTPP